jgi:regulator of protease activity HflC (stomatin/prohibitin superfamily)
MLLKGFRICQEFERGVVFRLGRFRSVSGPGLYWIIPFLEWQGKIDTRTVPIVVEPQETITKDSVTIKADAVVWYRIIEPSRSVIAESDYRAAVHQVALTSLRHIIGRHVLDEILKERDEINRTQRWR